MLFIICYVATGAFLAGYFRKSLHEDAPPMMVLFWPLIMLGVVGMAMRKKTDKAIKAKSETQKMLQASPYDENSPYQ